MRSGFLVALAIAATSLVFVPAGAQEKECDATPAVCTREWAVWVATHPVQAANPKNWHMECVKDDMEVCIPSPFPQ